MDGLLLDTEVLWQRAEGRLFERHGAEFTFEDKLTVMGTSAAFTGEFFAQRLGYRRRSGYGADPRGLRPHAGGAAGAGRGSPRSDRAGGAAARPCAAGSRLELASVSRRRRSPECRVHRCLRRRGQLRRRRATTSRRPISTSSSASGWASTPAETLALEDTASGIASAKAAGLTCIAVPQFAETNVTEADRVIDSLERAAARGVTNRVAGTLWACVEASRPCEPSTSLPPMTRSARPPCSTCAR